MFSRVQSQKASSARKPAAEAKATLEHFSTKESVETVPQFSYSFAGMRTFARGEEQQPFGAQPTPQPLPFPLQAKLMVGAVNDPLEQEADSVAEQVMRMPEPGAASASLGQQAGAGVSQKRSVNRPLQRKCNCGGACDNCRKQTNDEPAKLQMKATGSPTSGGFAAPSIVQEVLSSPGQPLDAATRAFMEPRFAHDFGQVRVHADAKAAESARAVRARAYTVNKNIVFDLGQYSAYNPAGKQLLAHELAHTLQQEQGTPRLLRQPNTECPKGNVLLGGECVPFRKPRPMSGHLTMLPDPDANEKTVTVEGMAEMHIGPKVDPSQTGMANDLTAQAIVIKVFGGPDGIDAVFERELSPIVKQEVDSYVALDETKAKLPREGPDHLDRITLNRAQFLARMRIYFDSWNDMTDHFGAIEKVAGTDIYLHRDAKARFERAAAVLKSKGHDLPRIGDGFSLRGLYRGKIQHPGMMIHAMGYAFDLMAFSNPRIVNDPQAQFQYKDILAVLDKAGVGPEKAHMNLDLQRPGGVLSAETTIEEMGKRTANDPTLSAADDTKAADFFAQFEQQFNQMQSASKAFTQSLSKAHREAALKVRDEYFDVLKDLEKARNKHDSRAIETLNSKRAELLGRLPPLMTEWTSALDQEIQKEKSKHPGMGRSPSQITADIQAGEKDRKELEQARIERNKADHKLLQKRQELAKAKKDEADYDRHPRRTSRDWVPIDPAKQALIDKRKKLEAEEKQASQDHDDIASRARDLRKRVDDFDKRSSGLQSELKDANKFDKQWSYVERLSKFRDMLARPDLKTGAGINAFERLTTGDLTEAPGRRANAQTDNPPLLRLLDIGFFNPQGNFDLAFFKEMAHSGFRPGASWDFGWVDSMHFELLEGRHSIVKPGKDF